MTTIGQLVISVQALGAAVLVLGAAVPKPCCFPQQWEGAVFRQYGKYLENQNRVTYETAIKKISTDYDAKKRVINSHVLDDNSSVKETYTVIEDFRQNTTWFIQGSKCTKQQLLTSLDDCIHDGAQFLGRHVYGGVTASAWVSRAVNVTSRWIVTQDGCFPLALTAVTTGLDWALELSNFQNVTEGIKHPAVFHVPDFCHQ